MRAWKIARKHFRVKLGSGKGRSKKENPEYSVQHSKGGFP
jgi:hypothetical protein